MDQRANNIASQFDIQGNILDIKPLGNGLINDTFKVHTDGADDYVLQRINNAIFRDVELLQHNIECATAHIDRWKQLLACVGVRKGRLYL